MQNGLTYEETVKRTPKHKRECWMTSLIGFVPFLDHNGILPIGGRLSNSTELMDEQMHPAILPRRHKVTKLFIIDRHTKLAHRGAEAVLASLQNDVGLKPLWRYCYCATFSSQLLYMQTFEEIKSKSTDGTPTGVSNNL